MKCPFPQKAQSSLRGAVSVSEGAARGWRCVLSIATMIDFVSSVNSVPSFSVSSTGSRLEGNEEGAVDKLLGEAGRVLWRTKRAAAIVGKVINKLHLQALRNFVSKSRWESAGVSALLFDFREAVF